MKKNALVFGSISGLIIATMMVVSIAMCYKAGNFKGNEVLGYTGMIVAFSFIFVGIKNYRDKYNNGVISFGKAFKLGSLITLVAGTIYVLAWVIDYYLFIPDFMEKFCTYNINASKASGADAATLARETEQMKTWAKLYENPVFVVLLTYMEVVPVGLIITLISSLILKRSSNHPAVMVKAFE